MFHKLILRVMCEQTLVYESSKKISHHKTTNLLFNEKLPPLFQKRGEEKSTREIILKLCYECDKNYVVNVFEGESSEIFPSVFLPLSMRRREKESEKNSIFKVIFNEFPSI